MGDQFKKPARLVHFCTYRTAVAPLPAARRDRRAGVLVRDLCLLFLFELRPVHPVQISQQRPCTVDDDE